MCNLLLSHAAPCKMTAPQRQVIYVQVVTLTVAGRLEVAQMEQPGQPAGSSARNRYVGRALIKALLSTSHRCFKVARI